MFEPHDHRFPSIPYVQHQSRKRFVATSFISNESEASSVPKLLLPSVLGLESPRETCETSQLTNVNYPARCPSGHQAPGFLQLQELMMPETTLVLAYRERTPADRIYLEEPKVDDEV